MQLLDSLAFPAEAYEAAALALMQYETGQPDASWPGDQELADEGTPEDPAPSAEEYRDAYIAKVVPVLAAAAPSLMGQNIEAEAHKWWAARND